MSYRNIHPDTVRSLLDYDTSSGALSWKWRPRSLFPNDRIWKSWNGRWAGTPALTADNGNGYKFGSIFANRVYAHQVAWCIFYREWPEEIDHVDHDRGNNSIENLRSGSHMENCLNQPVRATNKTKLMNISRVKGRNYWLAQRRIYGKKHIVGRFNCLARAVKEMQKFNIIHGLSAR